MSTTPSTPKPTLLDAGQVSILLRVYRETTIYNVATNTFGISKSPVVGTEEVYQNGLLQNPTSYTLNGNQLNSPYWESTDWIAISYNPNAVS